MKRSKTNLAVSLGITCLAALALGAVGVPAEAAGVLGALVYLGAMAFLDESPI